MKPTIIKRNININSNNNQWKRYQQFKKLTVKLDTLPEAAEVLNLQHRSAPKDLTEMVF